MTDSVGIIGAGRLGQAMARTALRAGRSVVIANSRGPESLASVVSALGDGVSAGTVDEAASAGIVVVAVPWDRVPEAVQGLNWNGQVVIDATNDWAADDLQGRTSSEVVADLAAGARVVKAANTLGADVLGSDPHEAGGQRVIFISGDDADAKSGSPRAVPRCGLRCDRPRRPGDRRRDAADPPPALRRQPHPALRVGQSPTGASRNFLARAVRVDRLATLSSQPRRAPLRNQIRHDQRGREEDQTE
jgi:8-hydroxy-5-deazaflavin:NADPH oxidoreductase